MTLNEHFNEIADPNMPAAARKHAKWLFMNGANAAILEILQAAQAAGAKYGDPLSDALEARMRQLGSEYLEHTKH